ncbi:hypothetical protein [Phenylobacterium sp.]|uniref:hypothetical protein n=1 Tax=Phenylobacterium sp. TaxID=1871053 RepID=UPI0035AF438F
MALDPAHRRYRFRTLAFMAAYAALCTAWIFDAFDDVRPPGAWLLALAAAAPLAGQLWATLALMRETDEYVRGLMAKRFIIASGLSMTLFSAWGFAESFARAPHVEGWFIYSLFWACYALACGTVRTSRA